MWENEEVTKRTRKSQTLLFLPSLWMDGIWQYLLASLVKAHLAEIIRICPSIYLLSNHGSQAGIHTHVPWVYAHLSFSPPWQSLLLVASVPGWKYGAKKSEEIKRHLRDTPKGHVVAWKVYHLWFDMVVLFPIHFWFHFYKFRLDAVLFS